MRLRKQREDKAAEEAKRRSVFRFAKSDIEKVVAEDAANKDYDDPWSYVQDVAQHGCSSGIVPGLIYYSETTKFYAEHKEEIWEVLAEDAENAGEPLMSYIAQSRWGADIDDPDVFENALAWYAYEAACQRLLDKKEIGLEDEEAEEG